MKLSGGPRSLNSKDGLAFTHSFGYKLLETFIAVIVVLMIGFTAYSIYHEYKEVKTHFMYDGATITELLAHSSKIGLFAENHKLLDDISNGIFHHRDIRVVTIYNDRLNVVSAVYKPSYGKSAGLSEWKNGKDLLFKLSTPQSLETIETANSFEFIRPVFIEQSPDAEEAIYFEKGSPAPKEKIIGYVRVVFDKDLLHSEMLSIILRDVTLGLIFIAMSAIILYIAVKKVTKPLNQLTEGVRKFGRKEEYKKIPVGSNDEIGKLSAAFNEMAENLKAREEEKKVLEGHLAQAKKIEAIGTLARGIAHDFNNLLSIIKGAVYVLSKKLGDDSPLQRYLNDINKTIARSGELTRDLLIFSGTDKLHLKPVDLKALIREVIKTFFPLPGENIIYTETFSDETLIVQADRLKLGQVITNIVLNAIDAMPEGGLLHIKTESVTIHTEDDTKCPLKKPGAYAVIGISDTGTGMDDETREKVFEPFFTTKEVGKGTGLGLPIVYGIIKEHRGYIDIETVKGEGTTFRIYLPMES